MLRSISSKTATLIPRRLVKIAHSSTITFAATSVLTTAWSRLRHFGVGSRSRAQSNNRDGSGQSEQRQTALDDAAESYRRDSSEDGRSVHLLPRTMTDSADDHEAHGRRNSDPN